MIPVELAFLTMQTLPCLNIGLVKAKNYLLYHRLKFIYYNILAVISRRIIFWGM
jgi:hypothetical protein